MNTVREMAINKIVGVYGYEHKIAGKFFQMCEWFTNSAVFDKILLVAATSVLKIHKLKNILAK